MALHIGGLVGYKSSSGNRAVGGVGRAELIIPAVWTHAQDGPSALPLFFLAVATAVH